MGGNMKGEWRKVRASKSRRKDNRLPPKQRNRCAELIGGMGDQTLLLVKDRFQGKLRGNVRAGSGGRR